jgi:NTE family protein
MKALVLSGGSIKGAFQAGAIFKILNKSFKPDLITGISVGSLNATFLADAALKFPSDDENGFSWSILGQELYNFWEREVTSPNKLVRKRSAIELGVDLIFNDFNGLTDNAPLENLLAKSVDFQAIRNNPKVNIMVGAVNLGKGSIDYQNSTYAHFKSHLMASTGIPIIMPGQKLNGDFFLDGGIRDVAPLKAAIKAGATEIVCIACQVKDLKPIDNFPSGKVMKYAERLMDVVVNELVNNDIEQALLYNELISESQVKGVQLARLAGKRFIDLKVVRPAEQLDVDIQDFSKSDIDRMLMQGYKAVPDDWQFS